MNAPIAYMLKLWSAPEMMIGQMLGIDSTRPIGEPSRLAAPMSWLSAAPRRGSCTSNTAIEVLRAQATRPRAPRRAALKTFCALGSQIAACPNRLRSRIESLGGWSTGARPNRKGTLLTLGDAPGDAQVNTPRQIGYDAKTGLTDPHSAQVRK